MAGQIAARVQLALAGASGGAALWAVVKAGDAEWIGAYTAFVLFAAVLSFFGALLAMAGPIGLARALPRAPAPGLAVGALIWLTALRYSEPFNLFNPPIPALAALVVATLPVPFLIAAARSSWRDYAVLFLEAWSIVLRFAAAAAFTGLVWLVLYLSDEVLGIVGIRVIGQLLGQDLLALSLTGAIFGLGLAVIHDLADLLSPYVVLRMFRLFLPPVLGVMVLFVVALPMRGLNGLASGFSPALLLLTLVAGGIALVSIAIDQTDADATQSPLLRRCAQGMALLLPVIAGLALWAVWLRVGAHGWTPERIFVLLVAGLGLAYGLVYAGAVLRGGAWMERIRQGNIRMALAIVALAALWLTPVLNAERISARDQLARFDAGTTPLKALDLRALRSWGKPGAEVVELLEARAREPGQQALAAHIKGAAVAREVDRGALVADLVAVMPVQPASATGTRDSLLAAAEDYQLMDWQAVCRTRLADDRPGCAMVVADLLPSLPGEEAMLFLQRGGDYAAVNGLYLDAGGRLAVRAAVRADGSYLTPEDAAALLRQVLDAPPPLTDARINQLGTGETGLLFLP